ncbi:MAG: MFS transporter [Bacteroidetes bacterium]|nr:MFS transporter [Bacteroidota bacterium]
MILPRQRIFYCSQKKIRKLINSTAQLYQQAYSGLTRRIWLLSIVMLINRCGTMVLAFMTLYCSHRGYSIEQGGLVVGIYGVGAVTGAFIGGKISDTFGFYYTQFFALFFGGVLFIVLGQMNSFLSICICTFFLSTVNESFRPANATAIAHYSTAENRTQSFSLVRLAINLGFSAGTAIGGILASIDYKFLFWTDGFTSVTASFCLLLLLPKVSLKQQHAISHKAATASEALSPYRNKKFLYFLFFQVLFAVCFFQLFTTVPLFFKKQLQLNEFWIGVVMAFNGVIIALVEMVLVFKLEGKSPYLVLIRYGTILMGLSFLLLNMPFENGLLVALISMTVLTIAEMISMPFMNSYYISLSAEQSRGQYAGLYTMAWSIAQFAGSTSGSGIAGRFGFYNLWLIVFGFCMFTAAGYYWLQKKH